MPGHFVQRIPKPHTCTPPDHTTEGTGTVWQCNCGKQWTVCHPIFGPRGWYIAPKSQFARYLHGLDLTPPPEASDTPR